MPKECLSQIFLTPQIHKVSVGQTHSWFVFARLQHHFSSGGHKMIAYQDYESLCDKERNGTKCRVQAYHRDGSVH